MTDTTHLNALQFRLSNERASLATAKTANEKALRTVWARQIEKEIEHELNFLGRTLPELDMTDDELLAELGV